MATTVMSRSRSQGTEVTTVTGAFPFELHETSQRILRYGNSFPSTFPEVLLAHARRASTVPHFSHADGAEAHGYVRSPPVEETVAAHLCPAAAKTLGSDISLPSKPCRTTAYLSNKAYASDDEAASALHAMAVLQIFQPAGGGALTAEAVKDLGAATDFALMALFTLKSGYVVVLAAHCLRLRNKQKKTKRGYNILR